MLPFNIKNSQHMPSRNTSLFKARSINLLKSAYLFLPLKQAFSSNEINKAEAAPGLQNTGFMSGLYPYRKISWSQGTSVSGMVYMIISRF